MLIAGVLGGLLLVSLTSREATATWRHSRDVTRGTAQVLEKGELTFGIFAPIAYGVTDALTVQSSPIFDLLLMPNLGARYRVLRSDRLVMAVTASYKQAFLADDQPGEFDTGVMATLYINDRYSATGGLLLAERFSTSNGSGLDNGLALYGGVHALLSPTNLVIATAYLRATAAGPARPLVTLAWVRQLRVLFHVHLVLSISYGSFPLRTATNKITDLSVWPAVDAWWRY